MARIYLSIIALAAIVIYAPIVTYEHVLDDDALIPNHPVLQTPFDVGEILLGRYWGELRLQDTLYRPLTIWTLAFNYWVNTLIGLSGDHPTVYRVTRP